MRKLLLRRSSPGLIVGCVALVVAFTGTSFALPGQGTVDGNDIEANTVGATELAAITPRTATGAMPNSGDYAEATAKCKPKEQLLSGGASVDNAAVNEFTAVLESGPTGKRGWTARMQNSGVQPRTLTVTALCLQK